MTQHSTSPLERAVAHLISDQGENGCWEGEMVWCTMILSQYIIVQTVTGRSIDPLEREEMIRYFRANRTPDGVWGLHPESGGYVFFTTLAYVALRLIGLAADDPMAVAAREWLHAQKGGVLAIPSWGKFWLALLDLYGYKAVNPIPPEMFLLPRWLPFHPHHYYCHTRLIYLGMAYLYGARSRANLGPIKTQLFRELYDADYGTINFAAHRHDLAPTDVYVRPSAWLRLANDALHMYERLCVSALRRRAIDGCIRAIVTEQRTTRYQALSPVNGLLNCVALWAHDPNHPDLAPSLEGMKKWEWRDDEGIRYVGARSHTWDTAFAMQAILEFPEIAGLCADPLRRAYRFLCDAQMTTEIPQCREQSRDPALGGWCFSDGAHRWPVSDCTAEALSAILKLHQMPAIAPPAPDRISDERVRQAVEFILYRQNDDGGFGTYERRRGSSWLEAVNPSEMFGQCMTELSYIECTASSLGALAHARDAYPQLLGSRIDDAIERSIRFLRSRQRPDGSFAAFWGINFTYAIFHVLKGFRAAGLAAHDSSIMKAAEWLITKQRSDGGWGEHYSSCLNDTYVEHSQSQAVMTSWALLALMEVLPPNAEPVVRGINFLGSRQRADGAWPREAVNGVFFGSAMLDYRLYKSYFPVWALARHAALTGGAQ
jgi:2,3-oxidosqualene cyclase